ncbi:BofC C-terminal domain-containing protein [Metabacillus fastidiosus]|uniref:BofC C-terminal domain-containing protein n=1 Tax=Metabacillus fastidiosus TaxID=1458 RepID=UPI003D2E486C
MKLFQRNQSLFKYCLYVFLVGLFIINDAAAEEKELLTMNVILERVYLDGEVSQEIRQETVRSVESLLNMYKQWKIIDQDEEQIVFQKQVDDISPLLKANGYFGIANDGTLTIFNGNPNETDEIIQSFFQLDVKKLETHKRQELKNGIRIESKDQYFNVIETFKSYTQIKEES